MSEAVDALVRRYNELPDDLDVAVMAAADDTERHPFDDAYFDALAVASDAIDRLAALEAVADAARKQRDVRELDSSSPWPLRNADAALDAALDALEEKP